MKTALSCVFIGAAAVSLVLTPLANAATTGTVTSTVTLQNVSVTVSDGTVTYGTLSTNTSKSTIASDLNDLQTVTNNGNITSDINIKGQDSAAWTLASAADVDEYVHRFCTASCSTPATNYTALTTSYQTLTSGLSASGTQTFDLQITTPTSSSSFSQQSVDITIQAVAS